MAGILHNTGLIIKVFDVSWDGGFDPFYKQVDNALHLKISNYSHTILADGGFDVAGLSFNLSWIDAADWFENGIGRAIIVYTESGDEIFLGVVNRITFSQGNLVSSIGPLMDIANDIIALYTPLYVDASPIYRGATRFTTIALNTDSIAKYGSHMLVLNAGEAVVQGSYNEAEQARDAYIEENAFPSDDNISIQFSNTIVTIALEVVGLRYYLEKYYYNNATIGVTTISGTVGSKLEQVIAADPNGIIANQDFDTNAVLTRDTEDKYRTGQTIISELLGYGGPSFERWTFGIYKDRTAKYKPIPETAKYELRLGEEVRLIEILSGRVLQPWEIMPGEWVILKNAFPGEPLFDTVVIDDRRIGFIESVSYTAPFDYQIQGARISRLSQMIARIGLKGIK